MCPGRRRATTPRGRPEASHCPVYADYGFPQDCCNPSLPIDIRPQQFIQERRQGVISRATLSGGNSRPKVVQAPGDSLPQRQSPKRSLRIVPTQHSLPSVLDAQCLQLVRAQSRNQCESVASPKSSPEHPWPGHRVYPYS